MSQSAWSEDVWFGGTRPNSHARYSSRKNNHPPSKLELLIAKSGKFQYEVAADLRIPQSALSAWSRGAIRIPPERIMQLADYFKVTPKDIVD